MHSRFWPALCFTVIASAAAHAQTPAQSMCEISGVVKDSSGTPVDGGLVKLFDEERLYHASSGIATKRDATQSAPAGHFRLAPVPCGDKYTIQAESPGFQSVTLPALKLTATPAVVDLVLYPSGQFSDSKWFTFLLIASYLFSIFLFRWHNIAVFDQKLLLAEIDATLARLEIESDPHELTGTKADELRKMLAEADKPFKSFSFMNWLFWTRGDEISSWTLVREVQRQLISLWPVTSAERLRARLETAEQDLNATKEAPALALAELIKQTLLLQPPDTEHVERWKQLLGEALTLLYSRRENNFALLTIWQSKTTWLALVACALIQASVAAQGGALLMLMGAGGGLLSRLGRALHNTDAPTDYGASWTTLFLSPLLGALSGWFGILLADGFVKLNILSSQVGSNISFYHQTLTTLALAFVLGFSERFFDSLVNAVDGKLMQTDSTTSKPVVATGRVQDGAGASVAIVVKPATLVPGEKAFITGTSLDEANVDGIKLMRDGKAVYTPAIEKQDSTSIQFTVPAEASGKFTLALSAKNSANPQTTVQVGTPATQMRYSTGPTPNPIAPGAKVKLTGTSLDAGKLELLDSGGHAVGPAGLQQTPTNVEFDAPSAEGEYVLVSKPNSGQPIRQKFVVKA